MLCKTNSWVRKKQVAEYHVYVQKKQKHMHLLLCTCHKCRKIPKENIVPLEGRWSGERQMCLAN